MSAYHYVIYNSPKDYPGEFLVRRWGIGPGLPVPLEVVARCPTLEEARQAVPSGAICLGRYEGDDPVIVETWW
jgi:hypothetical protein